MRRVRVISFAVSLSVLFSVLTLAPVVQEKISQEVLKRDAQLLLYQLHEDLLDALEVKNRVHELIKEGCAVDTSLYLEKFVLEHPSVRWIGIDDHKQQHCSNTNTKLTFSHSLQASMSSESYITLTSNELLGEGLALISEAQYFKLLILLDPLLIQFMSEFACVECLSYKLTVFNGESATHHLSGFVEDFQTSVIAYREENGVSIKLELLAKPDFVDLYFSQSLWIVLVLGLALAWASYFLTKGLLGARLSIERLIKEGINNREFIPFYQPVVNSLTNEVTGAEMLVRWQKRDGSVIPPVQFIEVAEQSKLILPITEQLVTMACEHIRLFGWDKTSKFISINLVPEHIESDEFLHFIKAQIAKFDIRPQNISLELTERHPISNFEKAKQVLNDFSEMGVDIKLDDAGTGFGGFSYIQELGINTLKIDKMFVDTIMHDSDFKSPVLPSIISFAESSHLHLIAEGVEEKEQVEFLADKGVFDIQGYYFGKPMDARAFLIWMENKS